MNFPYNNAPTNTPFSSNQNNDFDCEEYITILRKGTGIFENFNETARNHIRIGKYALRVDIYNAYYLWKDLYNNIDILSYILSEKLSVFWKIIPKISDKDIFFTLIRDNYKILDFANISTLKDKRKMLKFIQKNSKSIEYVDKSLYDDIDFIKWLLEIDWLFIKWLPEKIKGDKDLVILAIKNDNINNLKRSLQWWEEESVYKYISDELKEDNDIKKMIEEKENIEYGF